MKTLLPTLCLALAAMAFMPTVAAAAPPATGAEPLPALSIPPLRFTRRQLANGLEVIAVEDHASPTASVQVWYHVGSKDDPAGRSGFAHLFEHMMFKATRHLKAEQFDRLTEDVGGFNNAFTADDVTGYEAAVPSNHLETLLWAEADRMASLQVDQASFDSERAVVQEEYRQRVLASPYGRFFLALSSRPYLKHPYQRPGIGSIEDLQAATLADVQAFHRTFYRPDNATLVVAGDFDPKQLDTWLDKYFAPIPKPAAPIPRVTATEPAWTGDRMIAVHGPNVPLPAVALVWQAPPVTSGDTAALRVAEALLSAGESARLNQSLVYRQRIAAQAGFQADLRAGPGLLIAFAVAAGGKPLDGAAKALQAEVMRLVRTPPAAAELAKVKTQLLTQALLARETAHGKATAMGDAAVLQGDPAYVDRYLAQLQAVTAADVQRVLTRHLSGHRVTLTYTPDAAPSVAAAPPGPAASAASGATR
jgi:zinc protease